MSTFIPIKKLVLPIVVPGLLSMLNILNVNIYQPNFPATKVVFIWSITFCLLLLIWFLNEALQGRDYFIPSPSRNSEVVKFFSAVLLNGAFIIMIAFIVTKLFGSNFMIGQQMPVWIVALKLMTGTALIITIQYSIESLKRTQAYKLTNMQLQKENTEARFEVLKQQVNPHFLFNALSTLRNMVRYKDGNTEKFILNLAEVYRNLLTNKKALVLLSEEVELLELYLFMLKSRFEEMLQITISLPPEIMSRSIPSLSLQLLIENCVKHNSISSTHPLHILVSQKTTDTISIENNIQLKTSEESSGIGLNNLRKRYELLQIQNGVVVKQTTSSFEVTLKLL